MSQQIGNIAYDLIQEIGNLNTNEVRITLMRIALMEAEGLESELERKLFKYIRSLLTLRKKELDAEATAPEPEPEATPVE